MTVPFFFCYASNYICRIDTDIILKKGIMMWKAASNDTKGSIDLVFQNFGDLWNAIQNNRIKIEYICQQGLMSGVIIDKASSVIFKMVKWITTMT